MHIMKNMAYNNHRMGISTLERNAHLEYGGAI